MQRYEAILIASLVISVMGGVALAQADAAAAFEQGKAAYAGGQITQARDLFQKASQTDVRNPEVFLWLGKAEYQLGAIEQAIEAWTRTLKLAPDEPYAKKMLDTLRGQLVDVDAKISLVEVMLKERLYADAKRECSRLLEDKTMTDTQRVKVMTLHAEVLLELSSFDSAQTIVYELLGRYPKLTDPAKTTLLLGQAKMRTGRPEEGLLLLKKVADDYRGTLPGATALYELVIFELDQGLAPTRAERLAEWIAANPEHPLTETALARLVEACLALARQRGVPPVAAELSKWDEAALQAAAQLFKRTVKADEALKVTHQIVGHLDKLYSKNRAFAAAISGCETLLKVELPQTSRSHALRALARYKAEMTLQQLDIDAKAGRLSAGPLPEGLADVLAIYQTINEEFPANPAWSEQANLAEQVRNLASIVPWAAKVTTPKPPHSWAVQIALPVVQADAHPSWVSQAVKTITAVVDECAKIEAERPSARGMALAINSQLLEVLKPTNSAWTQTLLRRVDLLNAQAVAVFNDNVQAGRAEENAKLSDSQKQLLTTLTTLVVHQAGQAESALNKLNMHLQPWLQHRHYGVAEQAYMQLAAALPQAQQRQAKLTVARLWIQQVLDEHNRLAAAGLTVPKGLDPVLTKALQQCYTLQAGLEQNDPFLAEARQVWGSIVGHYKALEYFDTAEHAIKVKPDEANPAAEDWAQLQLANLKFELAQRELQLLLNEYDATEKITLTPAFQAAIAEYTKFIAERPSSDLRSQATEAVFQIAGLFHRHKAYDVAVKVYEDFVAFAAKVDVLSQGAPGRSSPVERAAFAGAQAQDAKARQALSKQLKDRKDPTVPPARISDEFTAAIEAYKKFITDYPGSVLLGQAIEKIMGIALEYAKADAWDVADGIYGGLLGEGLVIRHVERIEFCRGLCQLGKAMPDHAKELLSTLTLQVAPRAGPYVDEEGHIVAMTGAVSGPLVIDRFGSYSDISAAAKPAEPLTPATSAGVPAQAQPPAIRNGISGYRGDAGGGAFSLDMPADALKLNDSRVLAAIRQQEASRASQIAMLRERLNYRPVQQVQAERQVAMVQTEQQAAMVQAPVLSEAEVARQDKALSVAYEIFQEIRNKYPETATAEQARGEIKVMIDHWRTINQWQRSAAMAERFLTDNPTDSELPQLRLGIARDYLAWAAQPVEDKPSKQLMLAEVARRFDKARAELTNVVTSFAKERAIVQEAQWDIANSFLTQARVVDAFSATLARGQYVRAAQELQRVADEYADHPKIETIPQMMWDISNELANRQYYEEAITVWSDLDIRFPTHPLAEQAALRIAQTYKDNLEQPLRAAEAFQEVNVARGGNDAGIQNEIYQIGVQLKNKKRWVEALHVLEMFVQSFPRHPQAGQALTTVGQIHQTNEAWQDAIAAYRRVIAEFPSGNWVKDAKWAIAECTINLSQWREAMDGYEAYVRDYPGDAQEAEAKRRVGVLKDLVRYQTLVDEEGQRKAFDAQYQIATIVLNQLSNRVKAIIEYRKVASKWSESHLADDALYAVGTTYLAMGEMDKAREAARAVGKQYPDSPLADDALYMVGKSYEDEADKFAAATRQTTYELAEEFAQRRAYVQVQEARGRQTMVQKDRIASLKQAGLGKKAELAEAKAAAENVWFNVANVELAAGGAVQVVEALTAVQLANRQDKINAALRRAVGAYDDASKVPAGDKAGDALLRMATIYDERLKDPNAALATWLEIVRQFSGTAVAEDASWRIAQHYEREAKYAEAIEAYKAFLRNYRRSPRAGDAQFAIAENYEHLGQWVNAMDAYTNYINNFPQGPMLTKAGEQINWIKAYRL
jgi:TolA-binding protein